MRLLPSITVIKGRTARIKQGDFTTEKVYDVSPPDVARQFEDHGIDQIHLVDLDGARRGSPVNFETLNMIKGYTNLEINFAGGIQTDGDAIKSFESGATTITAGTVAIRNPQLFSSWIMSYGREKVMMSADVKDEFISVSGWQQSTNEELIDHVAPFYEQGLKFLKFTDITRDGVLQGPAFALFKRIKDHFPSLLLYASGGVRSIDDIYALKDMGVYGVIFGRA